MKAKEYLLQHGHLKEITRGRLSREHMAIIENAVRNGVAIEGYSVTKTKESTNPTKQVSKVAKSNDKDVLDFVVFYPVGEYVAIETRNGKRVERSMKEVCRNCGVSLVQCHCGSPRIVSIHTTAGVPVTIERA